MASDEPLKRMLQVSCKYDEREELFKASIDGHKMDAWGETAGTAVERLGHLMDNHPHFDELYEDE